MGTIIAMLGASTSEELLELPPMLRGSSASGVAIISIGRKCDDESEVAAEVEGSSGPPHWRSPELKFPLGTDIFGRLVTATAGVGEGGSSSPEV